MSPEVSPLSAAATEKLSALVQRFGGPAHPNEYGFFFDMPGEAGHIEFYAGKNDGGMLALRGIGEAHVAFAWDLMREMSWAILLPVDEAKHVLLTSKPTDDLGMLSELDGEIVVRVAEGPRDVLQAINEPFASWAAWRDKVVGVGPN